MSESDDAALAERIRHALRGNAELRRNLSATCWPVLGDWYLVDRETYVLIQGHVNLVQLAEQLRVF